MIEIVCKALSHNKARPCIVRRFQYWPNLGWGVEVIKSPRPRYGYGLAGQALDGDSRPISRPTSQDEVNRVTYNLKCRLCGNAVAVRAENLYEVFDKYRGHLSDVDFIRINLDQLRRALAASI